MPDFHMWGRISAGLFLFYRFVSEPSAYNGSLVTNQLSYFRIFILISHTCFPDIFMSTNFEIILKKIAVITYPKWKIMNIAVMVEAASSVIWFLLYACVLGLLTHFFTITSSKLHQFTNCSTLAYCWKKDFLSAVFAGKKSLVTEPQKSMWYLS